MDTKLAMLKSLLLTLILSTSLLACSTTKNLLPNAEFNALMVEADAAIHDGRWEAALSNLDQAMILQPDNLNVRLKQGLAYQLSGKLALAHNAYQQVIDAAPNPTGKNVEIVRAAKTNQAKLGFKPLSEVDPVPVGAVEATAEIAMDADVPQPAVEAIVQPSASAVVMLSEPQAAVPDTEHERANVRARVDGWALAWQEKRLEEYLAAYQSGFTGDFTSHAEWRKQRMARIKAAKDIRLNLSDVQVMLDDIETAKVSFTQHYQSAGHTDTGTKVLTLKKYDGLWLITGERFSKQ